MVVDHVEPLVRAAVHRGDTDLTYLVPGKVRPVLALCEPAPEHHRELVALRLLPLAKLGAREREQVRRGERKLLLTLDPRLVELPEECAIMISALVRLSADAIAPGAPVATLDGETLRIVGDRLVRFLGLEATLLVERALHRLATARTAERP